MLQAAKQWSDLGRRLKRAPRGRSNSPMVRTMEVCIVAQWQLPIDALFDQKLTVSTFTRSLGDECSVVSQSKCQSPNRQTTPSLACHRHPIVTHVGLVIQHASRFDLQQHQSLGNATVTQNSDCRCNRKHGEVMLPLFQAPPLF